MTQYKLPTETDVKDPVIKALLDKTGLPLLQALALAGYSQTLRDGKLDLTQLAMSHAQEYLEGRARDLRPWLLLCGDRGTGKSLAACWVLAQEFRDQIREHGEKVYGPELEGYTQGSWPSPSGRFITGSDLSRAEPWGAQIEEWGDRRATLVLDDLGASHNGGDSFTGKVEAVTLARYNGLRPLVLTSNMPYKQLQEVYPRVTDRANQVGYVFEVAGKSLRKREVG